MPRMSDLLAHMINIEKSAPKLEQISVINEFKDVFPD